MDNRNEVLCLLIELSGHTEGMAHDVTRHEDIIQAQAKLIISLTNQVERLSDEMDAAKTAIQALYPRNEYGLTEGEARFAHGAISVLSDGKTPDWKPWPKCHCIRDPEASQDARALYQDSTRVRTTRIYERDNQESHLLR